MGLGYVGLPLLAAVASAGFPAIGVDSDPAKIERLRRGETYLPHLGERLARGLAENPRVTLSADRAALGPADAVLICVPTPLDARREPDLSAVEGAARDVAARRDPARPLLVCLESTTYPGTTRDVVAPLLDAAADPRLFLAFSPEREDPGNRRFTTRSIPKLVGGLDRAGGDLAERLYAAVVERVVRCPSAEVAEAAKCVENVYRSVNIALVNELKIALAAMGLDVWEVLEAAATKPFGFQRFDPGPGFGGHCVPIDPFYLSWRAERAGVRTRFIELAGEVNHAMPGYVVGVCERALASRGKRTRGARVLVLGLAYKRDIADVRESPSFELIALLRSLGAEVSYHDPHVPRTHAGRRHDLRMQSVAWSAEELSRHDLVLIATDHSWYDWDAVARHAGLIVDTRNAMRGREAVCGDRLWKA
ncbi:MAG: nucleotide sugar dehydrogenase [Phycisphaerales bacterium]|nr:nucleotide sugar dehydrogenase [Phycisphaerales bacterium]